MNSRADLAELNTGETVTFILVFPQDASVEEEKISVLAPIGAGMLGIASAMNLNGSVPEGIRRMRVAKVHYQPEATGDFDR